MMDWYLCVLQNLSEPVYLDGPASGMTFRRGAESHDHKLSFLLFFSFSERFSGSGPVLLKFDFDLLVLDSAQSWFLSGWTGFGF